DPTTMDPAIANESQANIVVLSVYEPLVQYRTGTTEIGPRLATEWKLSPDGKTYTFNLRPNVKFNSGAPMNAAAVKFSFERLATLGEGPAFVLAGIFDRVDVVDDLTVNVVLKTPVGHFLSMLPKVFIVNPAFVKEHASADDPWAKKYLYDHVDGTGPFTVERWDHNQQLIFAKNPSYWGLPDRPRLDRAVFRIIPDASTEQLLLEKGDLDVWGQGIPLDAVSRLKSNQNLQVAEANTLVAQYIQVSQVKPPLDDPRVRKAIALAFDYKGFIEGVYLGHATQPQGVMARGIPFHDSSLAMLQKDIPQAKQLLAQAGHASGGFDLEYVAVSNDPPERGAGLVLQEGLKELGINLRVVEQTWPTMVGRMQTTDRAQNMQLYGYYRFPSYADPDAYFFGPFHTSQQIKGYNGTFFGNAETDSLIDTGRTSTDAAEREQVYKQLQRVFLDETAALFVANPTSIVAHRAWVKGYTYNPAWHQTINLDEISVEGKP
ncbi:MAG: ABC transporter substrate-binding protein, partial [Chloroflexota bacterium]|nr:ABC transporter substrate-binding protein [Chloroflexota bacterium]